MVISAMWNRVAARGVAASTGEAGGVDVLPVRLMGSRSDMDRGNAKHGPHLDEQMGHEVRGIVQGGVNTRAEEFNDPEPSGEDQPDATWEAGRPRTGGAPPGMTYDEVAERSRLGRYIPRTSLPGDRHRLLAGARDLNAPDDVLQELRQLPAGQQFRTVSEIWAALGHHNESVEHRT